MQRKTLRWGVDDVLLNVSLPEYHTGQQTWSPGFFISSSKNIAWGSVVAIEAAAKVVLGVMITIAPTGTTASREVSDGSGGSCLGDYVVSSPANKPWCLSKHHCKHNATCGEGNSGDYEGLVASAAALAAATAMDAASIARINTLKQLANRNRPTW